MKKSDEIITFWDLYHVIVYGPRCSPRGSRSLAPLCNILKIGVKVTPTPIFFASIEIQKIHRNGHNLSTHRDRIMILVSIYR